jgi:hypothetical protein
MCARSILALLALCLTACKGPASSEPSVQDSAPGEPRATVSINRILSGRYRAIAPACIGQQYRVRGSGNIELATGLPMRPGHIVEFRNYLPEVPTNVTALDSPAPLFSPNLVSPYNTRTEGDETFSYWRYAFPQPGVYEYFDTNMGEPGRKVVDSYYGTVSYIGESNAPKAVVCVDPPACVSSRECLNGTAPEGTVCCACMGVCCTTDAECNTDKTCLRGRCVDIDTGE